MKILLVEDSHAIAVVTAAILVEAGHAVETLASLAEVRERLKLPPPDAALLDWVLLDGEAGDVLLELYAAWPGAKVLILTGVAAIHLPALPSGVAVMFKPCPAHIVLREIAYRK